MKFVIYKFVDIQADHEARRVCAWGREFSGLPDGSLRTQPLLMANHCSFVLLAEFHIQEGAQLKYQFPQPLGVDER